MKATIKDFINKVEQLDINSEVSLDKLLKSIDLAIPQDEFINKFLNNDFKANDLKEMLGDKFLPLYQKFFDIFKEPEDFLIIKNWKIINYVDKEILRICIKRVCSVLIEKIKKSKNKCISLKGLVSFLSHLFSKCSRKLKDSIIEELNSLEQTLSSSKLIQVYFHILYTKKKISDNFKQHISKYIENNSGNDALSIWYKLVLVDKNEKVKFLFQNLKPEFAVINEDFVGYPYEMKERILLFTFLYKDRQNYFTNGEIIKLEYYLKSLKSVEEITKLPYDKAMKIFNNIYNCLELFKRLKPIKDFDEIKFFEEFSKLYDELDSFHKKFDTLERIISFFEQFYPLTKKSEIESLKKDKNILFQIPLLEFNQKIDEINIFKEYKDEVDKYKKIRNSIIFNEIYNSNKALFKKEQEKEIFDDTVKKFEVMNKLKDIDNLDELGEDILKIIKSSIKTKNKIINELSLIQEFFDFKKTDKFDIEKLSLEFEKLIEKTEKKDENEEKKEIEEEKKQANANLEDFEKKFKECFNFYLHNNTKGEDEKQYYEPYINYFKDIFNNEEVQNLDSNNFTEYITKKLVFIYNSGLVNLSNIYNSDIKEKLQLIKEFFDILDIYKKINNDNLNTISENLKSLFILMKNRMEENRDSAFPSIQKFFSEIVQSDEAKKKSFSFCFINMLVEEIRIGRIKYDSDEIIKEIFKQKYLIENCEVLINYLYEEKFFLNLKKDIINENDIIYFKDTSLKVLDALCSEKENPQEDQEESILLREQLLFYFEKKINKIFEKNYPGDEFIKSRTIRAYIIKIIAFFKEEPTEKEVNKNITLLYFISFLKVFFTKYITAIKENANLSDDYYDNILIRENYNIKDSLSYFILKLYLNIEGNFYDFIKTRKIDIPTEIGGNIGANINKDFGFDYLLLPLEKAKAKKYDEIYQEILNYIKDEKEIINDSGIIDSINDQDIDTLYCLICNLFLSKFISVDNYKAKREYSILNKWMNEKIEGNSFTKLNEYSKKLLNIVINMKEDGKNNIKINYNKDLMNLLFSLRFILNTLSKDKNEFYYNLLADTKNAISNKKNIFDYFFEKDSEKKNEKSIKNGIGFKIIKYIIISHLIFAYLLDKIKLEEISNLTGISFEDDNFTKVLTSQFKEIQKIMKFMGIKNKYSVISMNIIFDRFKESKLNESELEKDIQTFNLKLSKIGYEEINDYFDIVTEIRMNEKLGMNVFKKIIFEDKNLYKIPQICKYINLKYFTTPNFCEIDDFKFQYQFSDFNSNLIDLILGNKMDDIINKMNCLSNFNEIINKIYSENLLSITRMKSKTQNINLDDELINKFNEVVPNINKFFNVNIKTITNDTKIFDLINSKDSDIYKIYESLNDAITTYNDLLKKYLTDGNKLKSKMVQDFSTEDRFYNDLKPNLSYNRLIELIIQFSRRNRTKDKEFNIYNGDKIIYDFYDIEKILVKELIKGRKLLKNSQRLFMFSNEVFSGEKQNLFIELNKLYPQDGKNENRNNLIENINTIEGENDLKKLYNDMQYILNYVYDIYIKEKTNKKLSLKEICENIEENLGFKINEIFYNDEVYINDILPIYEILEEKNFQFYKEIFQNDKKCEQEIFENKKKEELDSYFKKNKDDLLLSKNIICKAFQKYIMRYCLGNHDKEGEILDNLDSYKIFKKEDIWDKELFNNEKFKKESNKLTFYNEEDIDNIAQYFLDLLLNDNDKEEEEEEKEKEEKEDSEDSKSVKSNKSGSKKSNLSDDEGEDHKDGNESD